MRPTVLSIAGSDSSASAGIQADLRAIEACGGRAATVITCVTAQSDRGVREAFPVPSEVVRRQLESVVEGTVPSAVKTGVFVDAPTVRAVSDFLGAREAMPLVCDPVLVSTSGDRMARAEVIDELRRSLFSRCDLITPNVAEARALTGQNVRTLEDAERAAAALLDLGARAVLIKGGHLESDPATDSLVTRSSVEHLRGSWIDATVRGTGCTYASAIATGLALGKPLRDAVACAKEFVQSFIAGGGRPG